jgi:hypothetical protein
VKHQGVDAKEIVKDERDSNLLNYFIFLNAISDPLQQKRFSKIAADYYK